VQGDERIIEFVDRAERPADLVWRSTNDSVVQVTPEGRVKGVAPGMAVVQGTSTQGPIELQVKVAAARLAWSRLLPLGSRTFLTAAAGQAVFAKSVNDRRCSWDCPGELFILTAAGEPVTTVVAVGRVSAGPREAWFESAGAVMRYDYAAAVTARTGLRGHLLARYADGDLLLGDGTRLVRAHPDATAVWAREFSGEVERAVIGDGHEWVLADRRLFLSRESGNEEIIVDGPRIPWAVDRSGAVILSDAAGYNFAVYRGADGYRLLPGVYSVLVSPAGLLQSEGLTASLHVPVAALDDGGAVYIEMQTFGPKGADHSFDTVRREGKLLQWRWGPSKCSDQAFSAVVLDGAALLAGCDRVVRIDDPTLAPAGSWPQPGADAGRSWRLP
jgi:hypothetical protein